jgi:hypothetical protein
MFGGVNEEMENKINSTVKNSIGLLSSSDDLARTEAFKSLIAIGMPAVPLLVDALKNSNCLVRWEAAKALGTIGDPATAPALVQALEDEKFEVRWRAAEGLTKMKVNGLKLLLQALTKDAESVFLREGAHHVLSIMARDGLRNCLLPVLTALECSWPSFEVPVAAFHAEECLGKFQRTSGEKDSASLNELPATRSYQLADLGARRRARRYARSLQHRTL